MGVFGGLKLTNKGIALQAKLLTGGTLHYNRMAMGDGTLVGSSDTLTALISQKTTLEIVKVKTMPGGQAVVGAKMSNAAIGTGFYFREIGLFAQDPDEGEILYCYGNAGASADFIAPGTGGSDGIEKYIDVLTLIGNASNVSATIDNSLIFVTISDFTSHTSAAVLDHPDGSVTDAKIGSRTIDDTVAAAAGADLPTRLWSKLANMIKRITGKPTWYAAPARTLEDLNTHIGSNGASHAVATTTTAGFESAADKVKLDGITAGANLYVHPTGDGNQHVPATGTTNNGKVLKAGSTVGSAAWGSVAFSELSGKPTTLSGYGITDAVQTRLNGTKLEYWNGSAWTQAGVRAASGTGTVSNGQLTVGGLGFSPDIIVTSFYSSPTAYLRNIGWGWNSSDQKYMISVSGPSPGSSYSLFTAPGDLTPNSSGFSGYVGPVGSSGSCSWRAYAAPTS